MPSPVLINLAVPLTASSKLLLVSWAVLSVAVVPAKVTLRSIAISPFNNKVALLTVTPVSALPKLAF